jgi:hypothetical protein
MSRCGRYENAGHSDIRSFRHLHEGHRATAHYAARISPRETKLLLVYYGNSGDVVCAFTSAKPSRYNSEIPRDWPENAWFLNGVIRLHNTNDAPAFFDLNKSHVYIRGNKSSATYCTYKYFVWVDDAYDMYTNTTSIVYPKLLNQSAQGTFIPGDFVEGYVSPIVDNQDIWEAGDIWIVANAAADSSPTPRGIYRLDVENLAVDQDDTFHVTVYYYNSDRRTKLWEQSFLIALGMRQLAVGNLPRQTEYASYYIVIQIANVSSTVNTALKYRLRLCYLRRRWLAGRMYGVLPSRQPTRPVHLV